MRVISGTFGGRRLQAPPGQGTRPMLDRVREALFSTLGDQVVDARVLDLFAGTGSLGIEALSRGASFARFVERDRKVQAVLEGNLEQLGLAKGEDYELRGGSALAEARGGAGEEPFDLIFMDPPYPWLRRDSRDRAPLLEAVARLREERLAEGGVLMLHVPPRELDGEELPAAGQPERRVYGRSALWYLQA